MTAAIFGLLGVIVGGVLTGIVEWVLRARDERGQMKAAARLLRSELFDAQGVFELIAEYGQGERAESDAGEPGHNQHDGPRVSREQWLEHQGLMARMLDEHEWAILEEAYTASRILDFMPVRANDADVRAGAVESLGFIREARQILKYRGELA